MPHLFSTQHPNNVRNALLIHLGYLLFLNVSKQVSSALKVKFSMKKAKNAKQKSLAYPTKSIILLQVSVILSDLLIKSACAHQNHLFGTLRIFYVRNAQFSSRTGIAQ
jgi:hypothetical protein